MFETYRMLGRQREAELQHEADRLHALPPSKLWARVTACVSKKSAKRATTTKVEEVPLTERP
jgi:hypothetical protein